MFDTSSLHKIFMPSRGNMRMKMQNNEAQKNYKFPLNNNSCHFGKTLLTIHALQ
jgi:predicted nucleic acid binding AN1-type Zn finger protein